ncbi:MAG TPA: mechanosensitive ion channel family protein [Lacunisphaera sp.]|nr:mechanosensitive ion channel family protein [Lacunisphaera sp.]
MKLIRFVFLLTLVRLTGLAEDATAAAPAAGSAQQATNTQAAAAVTVVPAGPRPPDLLEHLVDSVLEMFDVRSSENTLTHYVVAFMFLVIALLLRRVVTGIFFHYLKKLASKTQTTFDDKLFPALEAPASVFIMLGGIFGALQVLKLPEASDRAVAYGSTVAFSLAIFWGLSRALGALLDHAQEIAAGRNLGVAAFMPWIKKTLITLFVVFGVLMVVQSLGYDVKALLAGLGIGGLAFALAAQDTLANVFGSIVVAIDQPFRIGEFVKIGPVMGGVEDIGLRSTKLRAVDKSLIVIPNKTVAAEIVTNLSRFAARRVEQVIGLTYDSRPEQLEGIVADIRRLIAAEPEINQPDTHVWFRDFNASSLDLWIVYVTKDPDFVKHMALRQRLNLAIMRAVEARGLAFAFPTQTLHVASLPTRPAASDGSAPAGGS